MHTNNMNTQKHNKKKENKGSNYNRAKNFEMQRWIMLQVPKLAQREGGDVQAKDETWSRWAMKKQEW